MMPVARATSRPISIHAKPRSSTLRDPPIKSRHGQRDLIALAVDGQHFVLARDLLGHELQHFGIDVELGKGDRLDPILAGEEGNELVFGDEVELDENAAELVVGALLFLEGSRKLIVVDEALAHEEVAEAPTDGLSDLGFGHGGIGQGVLGRSGQTPESVREGLERLVLVEHEDDLLQARVALSHVLDQSRHHGLGGLCGRYPSHP